MHIIHVIIYMWCRGIEVRCNIIWHYIYMLCILLGCVAASLRCIDTIYWIR